MGSGRFGFFPSSFIKEYIELVKKPKFNVSIKVYNVRCKGFDCMCVVVETTLVCLVDGFGDSAFNEIDAFYESTMQI